MEYQETYAEMSDDEILHVASDLASLEEHARIAITAELSHRQLSETDIIQYRQRVASFNLAERPVAESVVGILAATRGMSRMV